MRDVEEPAEIREALEEGLAAGGLMHVPGHIGLDGAAAEGDQAQEPVAPLAGVDPEVVDRTGDDPVLLPSAEQAVGGDLEQSRSHRDQSSWKTAEPRAGST